MSDIINISSINALADQARKHPGILNIGSLTILKAAINQQPASGKGCGCGKKPGAQLEQYRPQFEAALAMIQNNPGEQTQLKSILGVKKICYFAKNGQGQIKKQCF